MAADALTFDAPPPVWPDQAAEIAGRLCVGPLGENSPEPFLCLHMPDGRRYDLGAMALALLDRLDAVTTDEDVSPASGTAS